MGAQTYDPALRNTEIGRKLYSVWIKVRRYPVYEEWLEFPTFYEWAIQSGCTIGAWLRRIDENKPYEPANCVWYTPGDEANGGAPAWIAEWNKTVNRIRKHCGMPPLEGTEYGD